MSRFREVFTSQHVILPVVHVADEKQAFRNVGIARKSGTDGVFLINHEMSAEHLVKVYDQVAKEHEGWWVGMNLLGIRNPIDMLRLKIRDRQGQHVYGLWVDNAMIIEGEEKQPYAEFELKEREGWGGLYFGGVAFKYQKHVKDLEHTTRIAARYVDVITTSGPGTGKAANPEKVRCMKSAAGDHPLAIASGLTPENVADYREADCFLVATGVSSSFDEFDPGRMEAFVEAVRSM